MSVPPVSHPTADLSNLGLSAGLAATLHRGAADQSLAAPKKITKYQAEFQTLQQQDTAELLYASGLSQSDAIANGAAVLSQAVKLSTSDGKLNYTTIPNLPLPGTPSTTSTTHPLKSVTQILGESDAAAHTALVKYGKAPAGSSLLDFQA